VRTLTANALRLEVPRGSPNPQAGALSHATYIGGDSMIRDVLGPALRARFASRGITAGTARGSVAVFPAMHPAVGDLSIRDDGDHATISIGNITNHQVNPHDADMSEKERTQWVTQAVMEFLERLFADRVLLLKGKTSSWGRIQMLDNDEPIPTISKDADAFLWSGPVQQG